MRFLILALAMVLYAGSAQAQLHKSPAVVLLGNSADTQVLFNDGNVVTGSANMTFDGTTLTASDFDRIPDDGNDGLYIDGNTVSAGGYDCVGNAPLADDGILNLDSNDEPGALFICLPDGVNYEFPKFDASTVLTCPGCDWTLDNTGVMQMKNLRFHSAAKDITVEFGRLNVTVLGADGTDWNTIFKFSMATSNGSTTTENVERFRIDSENGVEIRSGNASGGGPSVLKLWDLDNTTGSISLAVPDVTSGEFTNTLASNDGTVLTDDSPLAVTITAAATLAPTVTDLINARFMANDAGGTEYDLPTLSLIIGIETCFYDLSGNGITIDAPAATQIRLPNGTLLTAANSMISTTANAIGDFICILAIVNNQWISLANSGTWTDKGS